LIPPPIFSYTVTIVDAILVHISFSTGIANEAALK